MHFFLRTFVATTFLAFLAFAMIQPVLSTFEALINNFSAIRTSLETTVNVARTYYRRVQPTGYEFLTILGLALWNDGSFDVLRKIIHNSICRSREPKWESAQNCDEKSKIYHARAPHILYSARNRELCYQNWTSFLYISHVTGTIMCESVFFCKLCFREIHTNCMRTLNCTSWWTCTRSISTKIALNDMMMYIKIVNK